jgi:hypothetical protein
VLKDPTVKISALGQELSAKAKTITDDNKVKEIVGRNTAILMFKNIIPSLMWA